MQFSHVGRVAIASAAIVGAALLSSGLLGAGPAAAQNLQCFEDGARTDAIVARERLAPKTHLAKAAREAMRADVVRTVLCRVSGSYVYRVVLNDGSGQLRAETVNARRPFGVTVKAN